MEGERVWKRGQRAPSPPHTSLLDLHDDAIFIILSHCDPTCLGRLARVCRRLAFLARQDTVWLRIRRTRTVLRNYCQAVRCGIHTNNDSWPWLKKTPQQECPHVKCFQFQSPNTSFQSMKSQCFRLITVKPQSQLPVHLHMDYSWSNITSYLEADVSQLRGFTFGHMAF